ncbi:MULTISPECIES: NblA/ycf18 family protein [unclassified Nostoc]|uniref:NblA/ycf18 family protein n=3 Tax=unclassified Nostoc TaxID=2593658 RepID=UPI0028935F5F|nr:MULTISPECIES: NblA/ycf18 family protein [unclassified Nostoc]
MLKYLKAIVFTLLVTTDTFDSVNQRSVMMDFPVELTLEQQFRLQNLKDQVKNLSQQEAQEFLLEVLRQMMVKDNLVKHLLKQA